MEKSKTLALDLALAFALFVSGFKMTSGLGEYQDLSFFDEPQYIDYARIKSVATLVMESAIAVGNLDHRLVVDKPKPDPRGSCVQ